MAKRVEILSDSQLLNHLPNIKARDRGRPILFTHSSLSLSLICCLVASCEASEIFSSGFKEKKNVGRLLSAKKEIWSSILGLPLSALAPFPSSAPSF